MTYQEYKEHIEHSLQSSPLYSFEPSQGFYQRILLVKR